MSLSNYSYSFTDLIGNAGVVILLGTFLFAQIGKLAMDSIKYNVLNIIAATLLLINLLVKPNLSGIIIEVWWIVFSIYGICRIKYAELKECEQEATRIVIDDPYKLTELRSKQYQEVFGKYTKLKD